jgi:hypothetical protein
MPDKPVAADIEQTRRVARGQRLHFTRTCREPCAVQVRPPVDISGRARAVNQTSRLGTGQRHPHILGCCDERERQKPRTWPLPVQPQQEL